MVFENCDEKSERGINETLPFTIATKRIKHLACHRGRLGVARWKGGMDRDVGRQGERKGWMGM